ncbi:MAG: ABC transporter permease [Anaerolineae bacterium]|jgi:ABC-type nitrate/sulfonate/bicarbonate transport system permease component|nr:ABC transporter permease [Anaerolineae bacterium]
MSTDELPQKSPPSAPFAWDLVSVALILGVTLGIWEVTVHVRGIPVYLLPAPSLVLKTLAARADDYGRAALVTFAQAMGGLGAGLAAGILIAVLITYWKRIERGVLALAILVKATPMVAIAPLLTIWFGFGPLPKVILVTLITFFPVLINVHTGLLATDEAILALLHSLNASRWEVFRYARWPSAWPFLFAALKVVAPLSLVGAVVAEWAGASAGLGRMMWLAYSNLNMPSLFAGIFCLALMGVGLYGVVIVAESRTLFWRDSHERREDS